MIFIEKIEINAYAKINLTLDITGVRHDGYHLMEMVMQSVSLCDNVTIKKNNTYCINLQTDDLTLPTGDKNIAYKSAAAFLSYTKIDCGVDIYIEKKIPTGAGLGGGSADGAAVLKGMNTLFNTELTLERLAEIGVKIGADIPFCIYGNTALVRGIGEIIEPIDNMPTCYIVIVKPEISINTRLAFSQYDALDISYKILNNKIIECIQANNLSGMCSYMGNVFEDVVGHVEINSLKADMLAMGAIKSMMTGSGSAVFSIFSESDKAMYCYEVLNKKYFDLKVFLCKPYFSE